MVRDRCSGVKSKRSAKDGRILFDQLFASPDAGFYPVLNWLWQADIRNDVAAWQLRELHAQGIQEFFIVPYWGLDVVFASAAWWDKLAFVVDECKALGMRMWLYDEFVCPSGTCAGFVLEENPWAVAKRLYYDMANVAPGEKVALKLPGELFSAQCFKNGRVEDVIGCVQRDALNETMIIHFQNTSRQSVLFTAAALGVGNAVQPSSLGAFWAPPCDGYLDTLNRKAVRAFIDRFYGAAEKRLGVHFGRVIKGVFTDEPSIYDGSTAPSYPWTADLPEQFADRYAYDLRPKVHELMVDAGDYEQTRCDYWRLVSDLFSEHYFRQIADWCGERNLQFTGHLRAEETLLSNVRFSGDPWRALKPMHIPGCDLLGLTSGYETSDPRSIYRFRNDFAPMLNTTVKIAAGVSKHAGRARTLCEAFGVPTWGHTPEDLKKMTDWLTALGINLINDMAFPYSLKGFRRMFAGRYHTSGWWRHYRHFADYAARLCGTAAAGTNVAEIALLYPIAAAWQVINGTDRLPTAAESSEPHRMDACVHRVVEHLLRNQWEFDLIFDDVLNEARVEAGQVVIGESAYRAVILPSLRCLRGGSGDVLRRFVAEGGLLIVMDVAPKGLASMNGAYQLSEPPESLPELESLLNSRLTRLFTLHGTATRDFVSSHRRGSDMETIFLANMSEHAAAVTVELQTEAGVEVWDPTTLHRVATKGNSFRHTFEPHESKLVVVGCPTVEPDRASKPFFEPEAVEREIPLKPTWRFQPESPNVARVNYRIRPDHNDRGMSERWFDAREWSGWQGLTNGRYPENLSVDVMRHFWMGGEFVLEFMPKALHLVLDGEVPKNVFINGARVEGSEQAVVWDQENMRWDITAFIAEGINRLVVRSEASTCSGARFVRNMRCLDPSLHVEPMVLQGAFRCQEEDPIVLMPDDHRIEAGSWTHQGYPHYFGAASYVQDVEILVEPGKRYWLDLGRVRDTAEVLINDLPAGTLLWQPFRTEVTDLLRNGRNRIEIRIGNNIGNLLKEYYLGITEESFPAGLLDAGRLLITT